MISPIRQLRKCYQMAALRNHQRCRCICIQLCPHILRIFKCHSTPVVLLCQNHALLCKVDLLAAAYHSVCTVICAPCAFDFGSVLNHRCHIKGTHLSVRLDIATENLYDLRSAESIIAAAQINCSTGDMQLTVITVHHDLTSFSFIRNDRIVDHAAAGNLTVDVLCAIQHCQLISTSSGCIIF